MRNQIFALAILLSTTSSLGKTEKSFVNNKRTSSSVNYFSDSSQNIKKILQHKVFEKYSDHIVENIRQGEIGESQAFFIRLVKPFSASNEGLCFVFLDVDKLQDPPRKCQNAE